MIIFNVLNSEVIKFVAHLIVASIVSIILFYRPTFFYKTNKMTINFMAIKSCAAKFWLRVKIALTQIALTQIIQFIQRKDALSHHPNHHHHHYL